MCLTLDIVSLATIMEGPEGVKWNSNYFSAWEMGFGSLGLGNRKKWEWAWYLGKTIGWEMGSRSNLGLEMGLCMPHTFLWGTRISLFVFFFLESRDESTSSSSWGSPEVWYQSYHNYSYYHSNVLSMLCPFHRVCRDGSAEWKPGGAFGLGSVHGTACTSQVLSTRSSIIYEPTGFVLLSNSSSKILSDQATSKRSLAAAETAKKNEKLKGSS